MFPWLLLRAVREADVRREVEPFVGYTPSLLVGRARCSAVALWLGSAACRCPAPARRSSWSPVAFFTIARRAVPDRGPAQGDHAGARLPRDGERDLRLRRWRCAQEDPLLVELGVLLDVFVAVFVMGIIIFHISREFDHIDTDQLSTLKD